MKKIIKSSAAPAAVGPYSQAVESAGIVFVSGQLPIDPASGTMPDEVGEQTRQSIENIRAILCEAGLGLENVVKTTVFVRDMTKFAQINESYGKYFRDMAPARACVEVSALPKGASVEIEAIAVR